MKLRWLIRRDMPAVLQLDYLATGAGHWSEERYVAFLRDSHFIGMVAEEGRVMKGVMIYELHRSCLHLHRIVVHPEFQRAGVGTAMIDRLKEKLCSLRRHAISAEVPDDNLPAHLFFKSQGFHGQLVRDGEVDVIEFVHSVRQPREVEVQP